tara:strand:- start:148 stop:543 length:396 start_codon:yes stop_codon:yes gene_type:complete
MDDAEDRLLESLESAFGAESSSNKKYKKKNNNIFQDLEDDEVILIYSQVKKPDFGEKIGKYQFMGMYPHKINGELMKEVGLFDFEKNIKKEKLSIDEVRDIFGIMLYEELSIILEAESNGDNLFLNVKAII